MKRVLIIEKDKSARSYWAIACILRLMMLLKQTEYSYKKRSIQNKRNAAGYSNMCAMKQTNRVISFKVILIQYNQCLNSIIKFNVFHIKHCACKS